MTTTPDPDITDAVYTSGEVAAELGVSRQTVRRHLEAVRTPGGHRRYTREQVDHLRRMMWPAPQETTSR